MKIGLISIQLCKHTIKVHRIEVKGSVTERVNRTRF